MMVNIQYVWMFYIIGICTGTLIGFFIGVTICDKDKKEK